MSFTDSENLRQKVTTSISDQCLTPRTVAALQRSSVQVVERGIFPVKIAQNLIPFEKSRGYGAIQIQYHVVSSWRIVYFAAIRQKILTLFGI